MKISNCLIYLSSFLLLVACGSASKTTSGGEDTPVSESILPDDDYDGEEGDALMPGLFCLAMSKMCTISHEIEIKCFIV